MSNGFNVYFPLENWFFYGKKQVIDKSKSDIFIPPVVTPSHPVLRVHINKVYYYCYIFIID